MRLKEVTIQNFRGFSNRTTFPIDQCITGFVGKNDCGKSSILEALAVFFNCDSVALEKDDFHIGDVNCLIEITCTFDNLPDEVIIDETNPTNLRDEHLLNANLELQIKKLYRRTQLKAPSVFILSQHPTAENYNDLHKLDLKGLKARATELGVNIAAIEDKRRSASWRNAIWTNCDNLNINNIELDISEFAGDSKKLQEKVQSLLPLFEIFKVDRENKDSDPVAKSPLQEAVDLAKKEFADRISQLEQEIKDRVIERANLTIDKLKEMDDSLAQALSPKFKTPPKWNFDFSIDGDDGVPINKRGSGVKRLILLNFFRAEAERKVASKNAPSVIYAFEEPETSQHPNYQEMLIKAFIKLGQKESSQVLLTTHVPALGALLPVTGLRLVRKTEHGQFVEYGTDDIFEQIAKTLGILPDPIPKGAKALLLVEGPGDIVFLNHSSNLLKQNNFISHTLYEKGIALLIMGGCGTLKHWRTKKIAEQFEVPYGVFLDADITNPVNSRVNSQHIAELKAEGKKAYLTRKNEIENYISIAVLGLPTGTIIITDLSDAKKDIARAMKVRDTEVTERYWPLMTIEQIRESEKYNDGMNDRFELTEIITDFLTMV
ncbi:MAG: AAA family ATPase [Bacteroidales bacterium]|nr:AAA family ATPase [Bacteroidales bacterium]